MLYLRGKSALDRVNWIEAVGPGVFLDSAVKKNLSSSSGDLTPDLQSGVSHFNDIVIQTQE
jgi:hypothetical protein